MARRKRPRSWLEHEEEIARGTWVKQWRFAKEEMRAMDRLPREVREAVHERGGVAVLEYYERLCSNEQL